MTLFDLTSHHSRRRARRGAAALALPFLLSPTASAEQERDLAGLSIEDLMEIEVISVSKHSQKLSEAPAAVTVLSGEEIRRSGVTSIPEALRMVPGLHVASIDANKWAITSRGFNSQFANKLLVMIDGRSVYTPLFSGVFWDVQDVMLEDIDRIEVVRGPGGTIWGANAVNGVINIITKSAGDTQGLLTSGGAGTIERNFAAGRYGGSIGKAHYRLYTKYFDRGNFDAPQGGSAHDRWDMARGGLRVDWDLTDGDVLTVQGDYYEGESGQTLLDGSTDEDDASGGDVLVRWVHTFADQSTVEFQTYYDRTERDQAVIREYRDTVDVELRHHFSPLSRHDVIWGAGYRMTTDDIKNRGVTFTPVDRTDHLASLFIQDEVAAVENLLTLTVGSKFEHNDYTGFEVQPSVRALYTPHEDYSVWTAASRAVRTPSRAEDDVTFIAPKDINDTIPPIEFDLFSGSSSVDSEGLWALELGVRGQPVESVSVDIAGYYNIYDDLRSAEPGITGVPFPCPPPLTGAPLGTCTFDSRTFQNKTEARGYGIEVVANWIVTEFWRLIAGYTWMELDVSTHGTDPTAKGQEGDTPPHQFHLLSRLDLPWDFEFDSALYVVDEVWHEGISGYTRLDLRLGWEPIENLDFSVVGQNLLEEHHREFTGRFFSLGTRVPRSMYGKVTWRH